MPGWIRIDGFWYQNNAQMLPDPLPRYFQSIESTGTPFVVVYSSCDRSFVLDTELPVPPSEARSDHVVKGISISS